MAFTVSRIDLTGVFFLVETGVFFTGVEERDLEADLGVVVVARDLGVVARDLGVVARLGVDFGAGDLARIALLGVAEREEGVEALPDFFALECWRIFARSALVALHGGVEGRGKG